MKIVILKPVDEFVGEDLASRYYRLTIPIEKLSSN